MAQANKIEMNWNLSFVTSQRGLACACENDCGIQDMPNFCTRCCHGHQNGHKLWQQLLSLKSHVLPIRQREQNWANFRETVATVRATCAPVMATDTMATWLWGQLLPLRRHLLTMWRQLVPMLGLLLPRREQLVPCLKLPMPLPSPSQSNIQQSYKKSGYQPNLNFSVSHEQIQKCTHCGNMVIEVAMATACVMTGRVCDNHLLQNLRYIWGTSSAASHILCEDTPSKTHGNTLSVQHLSASPYTKDTSTAPGGQTQKEFD